MDWCDGLVPVQCVTAVLAVWMIAVMGVVALVMALMILFRRGGDE